MIRHDLTQFIHESLVYEEDTTEGLDFDTLYGLYISWCHLQGSTPVSERALGAALRKQRFHRVRHSRNQSYAGLHMVGPAARDYVMHCDTCWSAESLDDLQDVTEDRGLLLR